MAPPGQYPWRLDRVKRARENHSVLILLAGADLRKVFPDSKQSLDNKNGRTKNCKGCPAVIPSHSATEQASEEGWRWLGGVWPTNSPLSKWFEAVPNTSRSLTVSPSSWLASRGSTGCSQISLKQQPRLGGRAQLMELLAYSSDSFREGVSFPERRRPLPRGTIFSSSPKRGQRSLGTTLSLGLWDFLLAVGTRMIRKALRHFAAVGRTAFPWPTFSSGREKVSVQGRRS